MKLPTTSRIPAKSTEKSRATTIGKGEQITLSRSSFASLLGSILYPDPDNPGDPHNPFGPYGPGGPVMQRWLWAALNPQPLPPRFDFSSHLSWATLNPQPLPPGPDPYRASAIAHSIINRAASMAELAGIIQDKQSERGIIIVSGKIADIVEDWCGTRVPGRLPGPRPHFVSLFAAGVQFQQAADAGRDNPLRATFSSAAGKLFKAGLEQIEQETKS